MTVLTLKKTAKMVVRQSNIPTHKDIGDYEIQSGLMRDLVNSRVEKALKEYEQKAEEIHDKLLIENIRLKLFRKANH
ncbi:hypothetical protein ACFVR2_22710 [Gottfriedia sp. NPDC057991]|uniref:hypothetical protein n=1 Tax=Gottfriedia sp. NPDC057991 TaxID=3346298 RepID=UPI0036D9A2B1